MGIFVFSAVGAAVMLVTVLVQLLLAIQKLQARIMMLEESQRRIREYLGLDADLSDLRMEKIRLVRVCCRRLERFARKLEHEKEARNERRRKASREIFR